MIVAMDMRDQMEANLDWYTEHHSQLFRKYPGEFLVIEGERLRGHYGSFVDALVFAVRKYERGSFIVHRCEECADPIPFYSGSVGFDGQD